MESILSEWEEIGGYDQHIIVENGVIQEITCSCMWGTMEISRHPRDYKARKPYKHIRVAEEIWTKKKNLI
jgi:hypothetical protein